MISANKAYKIGLFLFLSLCTVLCLNKDLNIFILIHSEPLWGIFHPYISLFYCFQLSVKPSKLGIEAGLSSPHSQLCLNLDVECNEPRNIELLGLGTSML